MITMAEYDHVQELLGRKNRPKPEKHTFAYTGVMRCGECGCMITAERKSKTLKRSGEYVSYTYYHCSHGKDKYTSEQCLQKKSIIEGELEEYIGQTLSSIVLIPEFKDWALDVLRTRHEQETKESDVIAENIHRTLQAEKRKLDALLGYLTNETISEEEYKTSKRTIQETISKLESERTRMDERKSNWIEIAEKTFDFATRASERFKNGSIEDKKKILMTLGTNFTLLDGKFTFELHPYFQPVLRYAPILKNSLLSLEPHKKGTSKPITDAFEDEIHVWYSQRDSNSCYHRERVMS